MILIVLLAYKYTPGEKKGKEVGRKLSLTSMPGFAFLARTERRGWGKAQKGGMGKCREL